MAKTGGPASVITEDRPGWPPLSPDHRGMSPGSVTAGSRPLDEYWERTTPAGVTSWAPYPATGLAAVKALSRAASTALPGDSCHGWLAANTRASCRPNRRYWRPSPDSVTCRATRSARRAVTAVLPRMRVAPSPESVTRITRVTPTTTPSSERRRDSGPLATERGALLTTALSTPGNGSLRSSALSPAPSQRGTAPCRQRRPRINQPRAAPPNRSTGRGPGL